MSIAPLNYHFSQTGHKIKFQDWDRFLSECSGASSSAGVGECLHDMFEGTSKHCHTETQTSVWRFKCAEKNSLK